MTTRAYTNSFNVGVKACFCGKPTVKDHDFYFCSPQYARADAMRALDEDDCHYRKVMRGAYANQGSSEPAIYRHKSENQLRRVSGISQRLHHPPKPTNEKVLPTLAEVTSSILAREGRSGGGSSVHSPWGARNSRNESFGSTATPIPLSRGGPRQMLEHSLPSQAGLSHGARNPVSAFPRKSTEQTAPLRVNKVSVIGRERSRNPIPAEAIEEDEEETAFWRMVNRTEDTPRFHQTSSITTTRRSVGIRRSASFASWQAQAERDVSEVVFQLRKAWDESDVMPDFNESDEE